jgi:hypothetical protein
MWQLSRYAVGWGGEKSLWWLSEGPVPQLGVIVASDFSSVADLLDTAGVDVTL